MNVITTPMLDERPISPYEELKSVKRFAWAMFWSCIVMFALSCYLGWTNWQAFRNERALSWDNDSLRTRLSGEEHRRRILEQKLDKLMEVKP